MSRATSDLTQGFTGVSLPKTGPRQMGTDADGRTSVISFLNQVTESAASLHDNQTNTRPDYLPVNGLWCYTDPEGDKTVYQYDGNVDVPLWTLKDGNSSMAGPVTTVEDFGAKGQADTDDSSAFNNGIEYLAAKGGGTLWAQGGYYKVAKMVTLLENVHLRFGKNTVVDCRDNTETYSFFALGTFEAEIPTAANLTIGDYVISTETAHGYQAGDFILIKGQRAVAHDDAGPRWRLGGVTGSTTSPFFSELLQVASVDSDTQFTVRGSLLFPDYRIDNTQETYASARERTTVQKLTLLKGVVLTGGRFRKSDNGKTLIRIQRAYKPVIDISDADLGETIGSCVYLDSCFYGSVKARASRPAEWEKGDTDHSLFNSFKDVGCWYCNWDVEDINGCQGFDQSFSSGGHISIMPTLKMKATGFLEQAAVTHGCCYGIDADILALNGNRGTAFSNNTRFARIRVRTVCGPRTSVAGLELNAWGAMDVQVYDSRFDGCVYGIRIDSQGAVEYAPAELNTIISNCTFNNTAAQPIVLVNRTDSSTVMSNVRINNIIMRDCYRGIYIGAYWHGVEVDNVQVIRFNRTTSGAYGVEWLANAAAGKASNISGVDLGSGNYLIRCSTLSSDITQAVSPIAASFDGASISVVGTGSKWLLSDYAGFISDGGRWTPTITALTNVASIGAITDWMYSITDNIVTFSGLMSVTSTAAGLCEVSISVAPYTTVNFASATQCSGVGVSYNADPLRAGTIFPNVTTETLTFRWLALGAEGYPFKITGQYQLTRY